MDIIDNYIKENKKKEQYINKILKKNLEIYLFYC